MDKNVPTGAATATALSGTCGVIPEKAQIPRLRHLARLAV